MKELADIAARWADARRDGNAAALATVVRVGGSTYRRPGARMLVSDDGHLTGCVSGGCLERDVTAEARRALRSGVPHVVSYDSRAEGDIVWGFGLGCGGVVDVLVEPLGGPGPDHLAFIADCLDRRRDAVVATVIAVEGPARARVGDRLLLTRDGEIACGIPDGALRGAVREAAGRAFGGPAHTAAFEFAEGRAEVLIEPIHPPVAIFIFGAGHDAPPLARLAAEQGWRVTLVDHRAANLERAAGECAGAVVAAHPRDLPDHVRLDARSAAVIMHHNYPDDLEALRAVLPSAAGYVGVLGPRRRTERLLDDLRRQGAAAPAFRLHGPVGLDIGADNPQEIALAIVAEITAVFAGCGGGPLRDRDGPLHARSAPRVAGVILAAGDSTRMGRPKQLLECGGRSLLRRAAEAAVESGLDPVVVVLGADAGRLAPELAGLPVRCVTNASWRRGMGSSVRAGISAVEAASQGADAVLIMLCDQPMVGPEIIGKLVRAHREGAFPVVACRYQGTLGVPALFSRPSFAALAALPDEAGARAVISEAGDAVRAIAFPEGAFDIDTPGDYERLLRGG